MTGDTESGGIDAEAIGTTVANRIGERLATFEDRMAGLEEDLQTEVMRVRTSAQAIDLLADEVRRALQERDGDDRLLERIDALERAVREDRPSAPATDLGPVTTALTDVLDAVAANAERSDSDRRALHDEPEGGRRDLGEVASQVGPTDLSPVTAAIAEIAQRIDTTPTPDLGPLHDAITNLGNQIDANRPQPVDLTPLETRLDHTAATIRDAIPTLDLTPLHQRLDELTHHLTQNQPQPVDLSPIHDAIAALANQLEGQRSEPTDLEPIHARLDALADHVTASAPRPVDLAGVTGSIVGLHQRIDALAEASSVDLTPVHEALAEVVGALAQQIDDSRVASTSTLAAIEVLADRIDAQRVDLGPIEQRLATLADANQLEDLARRIDASTPDLSPVEAAIAEAVEAVGRRVAEHRPDLSPIAERIDRLITDLESARPEPVDLTPVTAAIADLRTHLADSRPDLHPVQSRLDELAARDLPEPDLGPIRTQLDAITALLERTDLEERIDQLARTSDTTAIRAGIAEVVEAGATQLETVERTANELRSAVAALAERQPEAPDLEPVVRAVEGLRSHYDETQPDLDALIGAMTALRTQIIEAIDTTAAEHGVDVAPLVAQVVDARQATETTIGGLRSEVEALARTLDSIRAEARASNDRLESNLAPPAVDLDPVLRAIAELQEQIPTVDLGPIHTQLEALPGRLPVVDLDPILEALAALPTSIPSVDLTPLQDRIDALPAQFPDLDLRPLEQAVDALRTTIPEPTDLDPVRASIEDLRASIPAPTDLGPVQAAVESVREAVQAIDLSSLHSRIDALPGQFPETDLQPFRQAVDELRASVPPAVDLAPVYEAISSLRDDFPELDLDPIRRDLDALRSAVVSSQPDLSPVRETLGEILASLAEGITESRNITERVVDAVAGIEIPPAPDLAEARTDLGPVLAAIDGLDRRMDDTTATDRLRDTVRQVADDVAAARAELTPASAIDELASRIEVLQAAVDSLRADDTLREAEVRLARRVDTNTEALRAKIDDQRALADSLAANVSQLNAALTIASEEPQQLRRDLDRILEQLAERMGGAMRELRNELQSAEEPLALRSSVEAGLDRITGRFQTDTGRILEAVAAAQDDADGRLRRIDNQVTELRRAVDRVRRESEPFEAASPG